MKISEIINEGFLGFGQQKPKLNQTFIDAFHAWQSNTSDLASVEQAAVTILKDPASQPYRIPPKGITTIYRTIGDINKTNTARNRVAVAYATNLAGAEYYFRNQSKNNKNFHVIQKQFSPQDFLLDFAAMCKGLGLTNAQYQKEHEIWMRPTQYYASYNADELVDRRGWFQKMTGNTQHPTVQAKAIAAQKQAHQSKELDNLL
jgi:hypothetical protein